MSKIIVVAVALVLAAAADVLAQSCEEDLASCQIQVENVTEVRDRCIVDLEQAVNDAILNEAYRSLYAEATRDLDRDTLPDRFDRCPYTSAGLAVDHGGCSLAQHCATLPIARQRDRQTCRRLDWRNDEPLVAGPGDCRFDGVACAPAVAEPLAERACSVAIATVVTDYAGDAAGVSVAVRYPDVVALPGFGSDAAARTTNVSGVGGLFQVADIDWELTVGASLINLFEPIRAGRFVEIRFDCGSERTPPRATDFTCTPDVATYEGATLDATCAVELTLVP